jgi:hypothetical protein
MKKQLFYLLLFLFAGSFVRAQQPPKVKFEKVSDEEMKMSVYEADTSAVAVILFDDGASEVNWITGQGFMLNYERFVRIKILKQAGTEWANFSIPLYTEMNSKEEIKGIKGVTTNFENGKMVQTEMKKEAIFKESENKYWDMVRLTLPSVKVGSVIDLKYSISSPMFWNLRTWAFQYTIPVKWSRYRVNYPEYFIYNHSSMGYHPLKSQEHTTRNTTIEQNVNYTEHYYDYVACDIPALKEEPYLTTLDNYTTKMKFELASMNLIAVGGRIHTFTETWADIARRLLEDEDFGSQIKSANYASDGITKLLNGVTDENQKMLALYTYIQHAIKWNGSKNYIPSKSLKKIYNEKTGNSADINLLLIALLKEAGLEASPVILSTRENGLVSFVHPSINDINYVIARVIVNGTPILLDATEPNLQAGLIPFRCLNGTGRLIRNGSVDEVALTNPRSSKNTLVNLELSEGKFSGKLYSRNTGFSAYNFRQAVKDAGGQKEYFDKLKNQSDEFTPLDYEFTNLDSIYLPVSRKYNITVPNETDDADILYFNPILADRTTENPFTSPTRVFPVDFGSSSSDVYQLTLQIPKGYKIEEVPQSKSFTIPGKGASYFYQMTQTESAITLSTRFTLDKTLFLPSEYGALREFFNEVAAKEAEQIVLKKID